MTPATNKHHLDSVVVLVVGTGSVLMSYNRDGNQFIRTGRSGGWGNLLGDDGSGYSLGREGLRLALETADELNLKVTKGPNECGINPLVEKIFNLFNIDLKSGDSVDLLDRILTSDQGSPQDASAIKKKITGVSRIVLDESVNNDKAMAIVQAGSKYLIRILGSMIKNRQVDPSKTALILAGGLMQNEIYRRMILEGLSSSGKEFGYIQAVDEPAMEAAQSLL